MPETGEWQRRKGYALEGKGESIFRLGRRDEGSVLLRDSLKVLEAVGDRAAEAFTWRMLAEAEDSPESYRRAVALSREVGDGLSEAVSLTALGRIEVRRGELSAARNDRYQAVDLIETSRASLSDPVCEWTI